jgi:hypothetical protein
MIGKDVWVEQIEQENWDRTVGTRQLGQKSRDSTAGIGQLRHENQRRQTG